MDPSRARPTVRVTLRDAYNMASVNGRLRGFANSGALYEYDLLSRSVPCTHRALRLAYILALVAGAAMTTHSIMREDITRRLGLERLLLTNLYSGCQDSCLYTCHLTSVIMYF